MSPEADNQFLDEVLGLFALEAQEWVSQGNAALTELADQEKPCPPERATKLYDTIVRGVSNLGGSAATVNLSAVEKIAFAVLPVLQAMQAHHGPPSTEQLGAVRQALDRILASVQQLTEKKSGEIDELESILGRLEQSKSVAGQAAPSGTGGRSAALRNALLQFHELQARAPDGTRNLAEVVLHKAEGDAEQDIDDRTVARILRELELLDQQFLDEVRKRAPAINDGFTRFKAGQSAGSDGSGSRPDEHTRARIFQDIEHLYEIARLVNSSPIMFYLQGLKSFLSVATDRPILISEQRYQAVGARVALLQALAERWVEVGRTERATIGKFLQP
jgi:chemotaxis protein histidine kinase CheA